MSATNIISSAQTLAASLFRSLTLRKDGTVINDDPEHWGEADATDPELVRIGAGKFDIVAIGEPGLAHAVDAVDAEGNPVPVLIAHYAPLTADDASPALGDLVSIEDGDGFSLVFEVVMTHEDLHSPSPFDLGPNALVDEHLAALMPGELVLAVVPALDAEESEAAA